MTRKRFSAFLLASALLLVFLTNVVFADGGKKKQTILTSGDYQYVLLEDGSAELLYCLSDDAEIVIPECWTVIASQALTPSLFPSP